MRESKKRESHWVHFSLFSNDASSLKQISLCYHQKYNSETHQPRRQPPHRLPHPTVRHFRMLPVQVPPEPVSAHHRMRAGFQSLNLQPCVRNNSLLETIAFQMQNNGGKLLSEGHFKKTKVDSARKVCALRHARLMAYFWR